MIAASGVATAACVNDVPAVMQLKFSIDICVRQTESYSAVVKCHVMSAGVSSRTSAKEHSTGTTSVVFLPSPSHVGVLTSSTRMTLKRKLVHAAMRASTTSPRVQVAPLRHQTSLLTSALEEVQLSDTSSYRQLFSSYQKRL